MLGRCPIPTPVIAAAFAASFRDYRDRVHRLAEGRVGRAVLGTPLPLWQQHGAPGAAPDRQPQFLRRAAHGGHRLRPRPRAGVPRSRRRRPRRRRCGGSTRRWSWRLPRWRRRRRTDWAAAYRGDRCRRHSRSVRDVPAGGHAFPSPRRPDDLSGQGARAAAHAAERAAASPSATRTRTWWPATGAGWARSTSRRSGACGWIRSAISRATGCRAAPACRAPESRARTTGCRAADPPGRRSRSFSTTRPRRRRRRRPIASGSATSRSRCADVEQARAAVLAAGGQRGRDDRDGARSPARAASRGPTCAIPKATSSSCRGASRRRSRSAAVSISPSPGRSVMRGSKPRLRSQSRSAKPVPARHAVHSAGSTQPVVHELVVQRDRSRGGHVIRDDHLVHPLERDRRRSGASPARRARALPSLRGARPRRAIRRARGIRPPARTRWAARPCSGRARPAVVLDDGRDHRHRVVVVREAAGAAPCHRARAASGRREGPAADRAERERRLTRTSVVAPRTWPGRSRPQPITFRRFQGRCGFCAAMTRYSQDHAHARRRAHAERLPADGRQLAEAALPGPAPSRNTGCALARGSAAGPGRVSRRLRVGGRRPGDRRRRGRDRTAACGAAGRGVSGRRRAAAGGRSVWPRRCAHFRAGSP